MGYAIAEYCEAHGAWGMMNFRGDFIGSPGTLKIKWPLYPVQLWHALGSDKYCSLTVTSKDYSYAFFLCSYFTFPRAAEGSFSCQQNFSTSQSKINREPYWHKHPPEERISPFLSENALVRVYEAPREKNHNFFIKKLKDSRKKEPFILASLKNNVCIVLQVVYTLFGESKSQRKDKEYISE